MKQSECKAELYGCTLIEIDRYFPSSKRCCNCRHIVEKLP
ncbi:MAG: zinc ribbon domain-containing protein [Trichodesmium sp. MAG_R02]|nr:zinc ribbon domain-containing protein [Trichodesmium sp. MAG_R02]